MSTAWSEPTLIRLASGFEAVTRARKKPEFLETLPTSAPPRRRRGRSEKPVTPKVRP